MRGENPVDPTLLRAPWPSPRLRGRTGDSGPAAEVPWRRPLSPMIRRTRPGRAIPRAATTATSSIAGLVVGPPFRWTPIHGLRPPVHPQLLDRRPHRPRQEHPGRPAPAPVGGDHRSASSASSCSTTWTWSASGGSPSRPAPSRSTTRSTARTYELNLIDTPGHVDFHYEVSRSLAACEGAILLVDATQGVQAQTVANAYLAINGDLAIVPALNKIDMQAARPDEIKRGDRARPWGSTRARSWPSAARRALGVPELFRAIIERVPPPPGDPDAPLRALIFDSKFDDYQGVVTYVRVVDGTLRVGQKIRLMAGETEHEVTGPGPVPAPRGRLRRAGGRPGRLRHRQHQAALRRPHRRHDHRRRHRRAEVALPGYQEPMPGRLLRPLPGDAQPVRGPPDGAPEARAERRELHLRARDLRRPRVRLPLRVPGHAPHGDRPAAARAREQPVAGADGAERHLRDRHQARARPCTSPTRPGSPTPARSRSSASRSPGSTSSSPPTRSARSCSSARTAAGRTSRPSTSRRPARSSSYELPLAEMIYDLYDKLKSATRGYGTMDYEVIGYRAGDLCRLDVLVAGAEGRRPLGRRPPRHADRRGRKLVKKLRGEIDRHQFEVAIQAAIGSRVDRPRDDLGPAQERHGQVLRRRHHPEAQAAREAEGGQEADEAGRQRRDLAGSLPLGPRRQRRVTPGESHPHESAPPIAPGPPAPRDPGDRGRAPDGRIPGPALHHHPRPPDVRRRGVHRADGLDGPDAAGQPQGGGLPELRDPVRARAGRGGEGRSAGLPQLRAGRLRRRRRRSNARATGCWCRRASTTPGGRTAGRSPSSSFPGEPSQAYVKRVVGLPGESIQILGGDVYIDGRIARKSLREQRAMRIPVFDNNFVPRDADRNPRWVARRGGPDRHLPSGWRARGTSFVHESDVPGDLRRADGLARLSPLGPGSREIGPVRDFNVYNGGDLRGENPVADLMLEARIAVAARRPGRPDPAPFGRRPIRGLAPGRRPGRRGGPPQRARARDDEARRDAGLIASRVAPLRDAGGVGDRSPADGRPRRRARSSPRSTTTTPRRAPASARARWPWECAGGRWRSATSGSSATCITPAPCPPWPAGRSGSMSPYRLGADEFFVLGDNSPVSNDSRFWAASPVVPGELFVGKPFLVHLPGPGRAAPGLRPLALLDSRSPGNSVHSLGPTPIGSSTSGHGPVPRESPYRSETDCPPPATRHAPRTRGPPPMSRTATTPRPAASSSAATRPDEAQARPREGHRETVEAMVVAFILALLVRGFEAEAFVIPTGSMAPTLMGRHKEVTCPECGHVYAVNASEEVEGVAADRLADRRVHTGICVNCRFQTRLDREPSFKGDRILVMKFPYDLPFLPGASPPRALGRGRLPLPRGARDQLHQAAGRPPRRGAAGLVRRPPHQAARGATRSASSGSR